MSNPSTLKYPRLRSFFSPVLVGLFVIGLFHFFTQNGFSEEPNYEIKISGYSFDPKKVERVGPTGLRLSEKELTEYRQTPNHYLVQLFQPINRERRARLQEEYGLRLQEYIPELAYLERLESETLSRLQQDDAVRAIVPFEPAFKISQHIGKLKFRSEDRKSLAKSGLLLIATLFKDANADEVRESLVRLGATRIEVSDLSKYGSTVRIQFVLPSEQAIEEVAKLGGIRWIEEIPEYDEDNGNTAGTMQSGTPGATPVWDIGLHGEGQTISVMEGRAADINQCMFNDPVNPLPGPGHRKVQANFSSVGAHSTFVSGIAVGDDINNLGTGNNRGNAWAARLVNTPSSSVNMLAQLNVSAGKGAFIHTNSWHAVLGIPTPYDQIASDVDTFIWNNEDHVVLGSMGNNGEEQGPPGTAKNAIGINAGTTFPNIMNVGDGNTGPTAGGRRKPDVVTPGCNIQSARSGTACTISQWGNCATSWATPAAAAGTALIRQYYVDGYYPTGEANPTNTFTPSGALIKATLVNGTIDMTGIPDYPSDKEGWGLVRLDNALFFQGDNQEIKVWDTRNSNGLTTGGSHTHLVNVKSSDRPLKVALVWSDAPAAAGVANPAVNDLNLRLISPDGTETYLGNKFAGGVSVVGGVADSLNNVEQALINAPALGEWRVIVDAAEVNVGNPGQGYAVVATSGKKQEKTVFKYAAKLVCGIQIDPDNMRLAQGFYATAINIHNPNQSKVTFTKKLSLTFPPDRQAPGKVLMISKDKLKEDEALEVDCIDIKRRLFPSGLPKPYIKGFVTITSTQALNVTAVYSTRSLDQKLCCSKPRSEKCCAPKDKKDCCASHGNCCEKEVKPSCCKLSGGHSSIDVEQIIGKKIQIVHKPRKLPDLIPIEHKSSTSPFFLYRDGKLVVVIKNQGSATSKETVTHVYYKNKLISPQEYTVATPKLEKGQDVKLLFPWPDECSGVTSPGSPTTLSTCSFRITADFGNVEEEELESNNVAEGFGSHPQ